jgi:hypothetical protein
LRVLILSDGKAGHLNQSIAFAKLKGLEFDVLEFQNSLKPLTYLLDFLGIYINLFALHVEDKNYKAVVSAGSSTYYANRYLAKKLGIKSIAIMMPRGFRLKGFDYILALKHDNPKQANNIITLPIALATSEAKGHIKDSGVPSLGIILGGNNSVFEMKKEDIKKVLDSIFANYPEHLKYITTSRRTPKEVEELLEDYSFDYKLIYSQNPSINPIPDFLKLCSELFITIDSASMLSEARANSEAKIHIIELKSDKKDTKFHRLAKQVEELSSKFDFKPYLKRVEL